LVLIILTGWTKVIFNCLLIYKLLKAYTKAIICSDDLNQVFRLRGKSLPLSKITSPYLKQYQFNITTNALGDSLKCYRENKEILKLNYVQPLTKLRFGDHREGFDIRHPPDAPLPQSRPSDRNPDPCRGCEPATVGRPRKRSTGHHRLGGGSGCPVERNLPAGQGKLHHRQRPQDQPGLLPTLKSPSDKLDDFYFIEQEDPEKVLELIISLVKDRIPNRFRLKKGEEIQVLTPMHRGIVGAGNLNVELQKALNPREDGVIRGGRTFKIHDRVMQIANNYDKEVFNGDIVRIASIDEEAQVVKVAIDDREIAYDYTDLDELVHAYAVSIHKSQGSEYPAVVIPILTQHYVLLQRNLLYTGVTRGKKLVVLVGTKKALAIAVKNDRTEKRYTRLRDRLGTR
jgi:hypothetical protein